LDDLIKTPFRMRVYPVSSTEGTEWVAEYPELPGCIGCGDTPEEAVTMAEDAKKGWLEIALEDGREIPVSSSLYNTDFSGKFTFRIPKSLHRELSLAAEEEGLSLNQYLLYLITKNHYETQRSGRSDIKRSIHTKEISIKVVQEEVASLWEQNRSPVPYQFSKLSRGPRI